MASEYLEDNLVKPDSIEMRDYQVSLASQAKTQNSLIVLPTGLGKTTIALQVILDMVQMWNKVLHLLHQLLYLV